MKIHQSFSYENPDFADSELGIFAEIIELHAAGETHFVGIKQTDSADLQCRVADFIDTSFAPFHGEIQCNLYFVLRNDMRSRLGVMVLTPTKLKFKDSPVYLIDFIKFFRVRPSAF